MNLKKLPECRTDVDADAWELIQVNAADTETGITNSIPVLIDPYKIESIHPHASSKGRHEGKPEVLVMRMKSGKEWLIDRPSYELIMYLRVSVRRARPTEKRTAKKRV